MKIIPELDPALQLSDLIFKVYKKFNKKVVILVDEYDKPILDNLSKDNKSTAYTAREILKNFYGSIKDNDEYLRFVFITGVSKFSKLNLFSGLNNIEDITNRFSFLYNCRLY